MEKIKNVKTIKYNLDPRLKGFHFWISKIQDDGVTANIPIQHIVGAAIGIKDEGLKFKSQVEALERYCLYTKNPKLDGVLHKMSRFPLEKCILYSAAQEKEKDFPFLRRSLGAKTPWIGAKILGRGKAMCVPYNYVYPRKNLSRELLLDGWSTSGGAAHTSLLKASINGTLELVERDSIMCSWISRSGISRIDIDSVYKNTTRQLIETLSRLGLEVSLFASKNELGIVTVISVLDNPTEKFHSFGSACRADIFIAIEKAIYESVMIRNTQYELVRHNLVKKSTGLLRHVAAPIIYGRKMTGWLFDSKIPTETISNIIKSQPSTDGQIAEIIQKKFTVLVINFSNTTLSKKISVVKCIAPELHPLEISAERIHGDLRRIISFSGRSKININPYIHPFG